MMFVRQSVCLSVCLSVWDGRVLRSYGALQHGFKFTVALIFSGNGKRWHLNDERIGLILEE